MFTSDYRIEAFNILLNEDCILKCYHPLIAYKHQLADGLLRRGCLTNENCRALSDAELAQVGLPENMTGLFRQFLRLYDYKGRDIKDIPDAESKAEDEIVALLELMRLPGVKAIRAQLYYHCGLRSLADFTASDAESLRLHIAGVIARDGLLYSTPLPKELRTQIAVAMAFTEYAV